MSIDSALQLKSYCDVRAALLDPRLVIHKPLSVGAENDHLGGSALGQHSHRMLPIRKSLAQQLSLRNIEPLVGFIEEAVDRIVSRAEARGGMEVVHDLAFPLPVAVMAEVLGLPQQDFSQLRPLLEAISRGHDMGASEATRQQARFAQAAIIRWLGPQLRSSRTTPMLDAISSIADTESYEGKATYWCMMLLYAGSATTRDLIANGIGLLLENPEAARQLAKDDAPIDAAVEEILRFDGPVRGIGRVASMDLAIGDHQITQGDLIFLMVVEANRDPGQFPDPNRFDITRSPNAHLAFGTGVTHCLGAQLARLQARIVLARIRQLLPQASARDLADWSPMHLVSQRNSLEVSFTSAQF